jgi:hypothetical protein
MENQQKVKDSLNSLLDKQEDKGIKMSKEEEIGFHKGSLNTLAAERNELIKMIGNIEAIMQAHIKRLQELGINIANK